jgi:ketosteroid isomerase-like protein
MESGPDILAQAMSREKIEMARRMMALFDVPGELIESADPARRLSDSVLNQFADAEIELIPLAQGLLSGNTYKGFEGTRRYWSDFSSTWSEFRIEPQEFLDAAPQVVAVFRVKGRIHELEVNEIWSSLWTFRDGKVIKFQTFSTPTGALEAAGLTR